jgi:hypothetical protein
VQRVYTIEKTSKRLKADQFFAWLLFMIGVAAVGYALSHGTIDRTPISRGFGVGGSLACLFGFGWLVVNRWQRWWHHG